LCTALGEGEVNDTMTLLAELEEFVGDHCPHGTLACDVTEPAWNGIGSRVACPCGVGVWAVGDANGC
jgi:hypothetical protein